MTEERELTKEEERFLDALDGNPCEDCGKYGEDVRYESCPFASEIHGDYTKVWLCGDCSHERAMDI